MFAYVVTAIVLSSGIIACVVNHFYCDHNPVQIIIAQTAQSEESFLVHTCM